MMNSSEQDASRSPTTRLYWIFQFVGWGLYGITYLFFQVLYRPSNETLAHVLLTNGIIAAEASCIGLVLTQWWRLFMRKKNWVERSHGLPILKLLSGICVLATLQLGLVCCLYYFIRPFTESELGEWLQHGWQGNALGWFSIYLVWTVLYVATVSRRYAQRIEIEKLSLELHVKDAELRALQAQVNPHFFFNSLNSIRALVFQDAEIAAEAIDRLASMMRYTLQSGRFDTVPLAQEMQAVRNYLAIEKIRFEERLQLSEDIASGLDNMAFPPMALQTLVENAVKYGVEPSAMPCELRIAASREENRMHLTVSNQGKLQETTGSTKLGVRNASKRLALLFGAEAGVDLFERDGWVTARLVLPCKDMGAACG